MGKSSSWLFSQSTDNPIWEKVITDPRESVKKTYIKEKYRVFEEFAIDPGTSRHSRRLDALIAENISVPPHTDNQVNLIGVEIKVDVNDLKNDKFPYGKPQTDEVARGSGTESMAVRD